MSQGVADAAHPAGWTRWLLSTDSPPRCPPALAAFGPTWSSTAEAASTPPSPSTTAAATAWCARARPLRRRSLYDRLRAIAGYDYTRRPSAVLVLVPSVWEERLTTRFCERLNLDDCYVAVESRDSLERRDLRLWHKYSWVGSTYRSWRREFARQPRRKAFHRITGAEAGFDTPSRADGTGCAGLRRQPV